MKLQDIIPALRDEEPAAPPPPKSDVEKLAGCALGCRDLVIIAFVVAVILAFIVIVGAQGSRP